MNGKGSRPRTFSTRQYGKRYDKINWKGKSNEKNNRDNKGYDFQGVDKANQSVQDVVQDRPRGGR
jgi:hypothetical protein